MIKICTYLTLAAVVVSAFSSSLNAQMLRGKCWQWQNPQNLAISEMIAFEAEQKFSMLQTNLDQQQTQRGKGEYSKENGVLTLEFDNGNKATFDIEFYNDGLVFVATDKDGVKYKYAVCNSTFDTYFNRYMASRGLNPTQSPTPYVAPQKQETCYTCFGSGRCQVCKGSGRVSGMYGQPSSDCTACNKTGKCWHCQGSGKQ